MPLQATSGAASYDAFGGGVPFEPTYIEQVFATHLYTGTGSAQAITNGIDLSTKGGLVWIKKRNDSFQGQHILSDTVRGAAAWLSTNSTGAAGNDSNRISSFLTNGFSIGTEGTVNSNSNTFASWTFRKQPKFFDVVTFTSSASGNKTFSHNLGAVPGCVIIKNTQTADPWLVYHRSVGDNAYLLLNTTDAQSPLTGAFSATSTTFTISSSLMYNSQNYVAYLFAHNAGGFGLTGTDNVISCGSFTTNGSTTTTVNLGYEPQWVMVKRSNGADPWWLLDNMRGLAVSGSQPALFPNTSGAESLGGWTVTPTATGFDVPISSNFNENGFQFIYIAIRRGPMKTPTSGTSVFAPVTAVSGTQTTGFPVDMMMQFWRTANDIYANTEVVDRLRGVSSNSTARSTYLLTSSSGAEDSLGSINASLAWTNTGFDVPPAYVGGSNGFECFRRAPGFFDVVCYTGTGSARTVAHNLTVVPELIITKRRNLGGNWNTYSAALGNTGILFLDDTSGNLGPDSSNWNNTSPTSSVFTVGTGAPNLSGGTYVAYLFASCPGVSKVGTFTGTGATQVINCGFTGGARFVLIKRTDSTGDWLVWDSARGIVAGNDPYLMLNSTAAEVTNTDWVDTAATGFELSNAAGNLANINGASYIFLAVS